jgi:hypothetical protein
MFCKASAPAPTARQMSRQSVPGPGAMFNQSGRQIGGRASGAAAGGEEGSGRQQLTGFEGCEELFDDPAVYPAYAGGACQAQHSGKVGAGSGRARGPAAGCRRWAQPGSKARCVESQ